MSVIWFDSQKRYSMQLRGVNQLDQDREEILMSTDKLFLVFNLFFGGTGI